MFVQPEFNNPYSSISPEEDRLLCRREQLPTGREGEKVTVELASSGSLPSQSLTATFQAAFQKAVDDTKPKATPLVLGLGPFISSSSSSGLPPSPFTPGIPSGAGTAAAAATTWGSQNATTSTPAFPPAVSPAISWTAALALAKSTSSAPLLLSTNLSASKISATDATAAAAASPTDSSPPPVSEGDGSAVTAPPPPPVQSIKDMYRAMRDCIEVTACCIIERLHVEKIASLVQMDLHSYAAANASALSCLLHLMRSVSILGVEGKPMKAIAPKLMDALMPVIEAYKGLRGDSAVVEDGATALTLQSAYILFLICISCIAGNKKDEGCGEVASPTTTGSAVGSSVLAATRCLFASLARSFRSLAAQSYKISDEFYSALSIATNLLDTLRPFEGGDRACPLGMASRPPLEGRGLLHAQIYSAALESLTANDADGGEADILRIFSDVLILQRDQDYIIGLQYQTVLFLLHTTTLRPSAVDLYYHAECMRLLINSAFKKTPPANFGAFNKLAPANKAAGLPAAALHPHACSQRTAIAILTRVVEAFNAMEDERLALMKAPTDSEGAREEAAERVEEFSNSNSSSSSSSGSGSSSASSLSEVATQQQAEQRIDTRGMLRDAIDALGGISAQPATAGAVVVGTAALPFSALAIPPKILDIGEFSIKSGLIRCIRACLRHPSNKIDLDTAKELFVKSKALIPTAQSLASVLQTGTDKVSLGNADMMARSSALNAKLSYSERAAFLADLFACLGEAELANLRSVSSSSTASAPAPSSSITAAEPSFMNMALEIVTQGRDRALAHAAGCANTRTEWLRAYMEAVILLGHLGATQYPTVSTVLKSVIDVASKSMEQRDDLEAPRLVNAVAGITCNPYYSAGREAVKQSKLLPGLSAWLVSMSESASAAASVRSSVGAGAALESSGNSSNLRHMGALLLALPAASSLLASVYRQGEGVTGDSYIPTLNVISWLLDHPRASIHVKCNAMSALVALCQRTQLGAAKERMATYLSKTEEGPAMVQKVLKCMEDVRARQDFFLNVRRNEVLAAEEERRRVRDYNMKNPAAKAEAKIPPSAVEIEAIAPLSKLLTHGAEVLQQLCKNNLEALARVIDDASSDGASDAPPSPPPPPPPAASAVVPSTDASAESLPASDSSSSSSSSSSVAIVEDSIPKVDHNATIVEGVESSTENEDEESKQAGPQWNAQGTSSTSSSVFPLPSTRALGIFGAPPSIPHPSLKLQHHNSMITDEDHSTGSSSFRRSPQKLISAKGLLRLAFHWASSDHRAKMSTFDLTPEDATLVRYSQWNRLVLLDILQKTMARGLPVLRTILRTPSVLTAATQLLERLAHQTDKAKAAKEVFAPISLAVSSIIHTIAMSTRQKVPEPSSMASAAPISLFPPSASSSSSSSTSSSSPAPILSSLPDGTVAAFLARPELASFLLSLLKYVASASWATAQRETLDEVRSMTLDICRWMASGGAAPRETLTQLTDRVLPDAVQKALLEDKKVQEANDKINAAAAAAAASAATAAATAAAAASAYGGQVVKQRPGQGAASTGMTPSPLASSAKSLQVANHSSIRQLLDLLVGVTEVDDPKAPSPSSAAVASSIADPKKSGLERTSAVGGLLLSILADNVQHLRDALKIDDVRVKKLALLLLGRTLRSVDKFSTKAGFGKTIYSPVWKILESEASDNTVRAAAAGLLGVALGNCADDGEIEFLCRSLVASIEAPSNSGSAAPATLPPPSYPPSASTNPPAAKEAPYLDVFSSLLNAPTPMALVAKMISVCSNLNAKAETAHNDLSNAMPTLFVAIQAVGKLLGESVSKERREVYRKEASSLELGPRIMKAAELCHDAGGNVAEDWGSRVYEIAMEVWTTQFCDFRDPEGELMQNEVAAATAASSSSSSSNSSSSSSSNSSSSSSSNSSSSSSTSSPDVLTTMMTKIAADRALKQAKVAARVLEGGEKVAAPLSVAQKAKSLVERIARTNIAPENQMALIVDMVRLRCREDAPQDIQLAPMDAKLHGGISALLEKKYRNAYDLCDESKDNRGKLYSALTQLREGWDGEEPRRRLREYLAACRTASDVDPVFLYASYLVHAALKPASSNVPKAIIFLKTFALFPESALWLGPKDTPENIQNGKAEVVDDSTDPTHPRNKWERAKQEMGAKSEAMDDLMQMIGLRNIKQEALDLYYMQQLASIKGSAASKSRNNHYVFQGNSGTGKTVVARLMAKLLYELGVRTSKDFKSMSGAEALREGPEAFKTVLDDIDGGVLFLDECYKLNPESSNDGRDILNLLLTFAEDKRATTSIIIAGYRDEIDKLIAFNAGLSSRFPSRWVFEDYNEVELRNIFNLMVAERGHNVEHMVPSVASIAAARLSRGGGQQGFGNARAVRNMVENATKRHDGRIGANLLDSEVTREAALRLSREDVLGSKPDLINCPELLELQRMTGLEEVKQTVMDLMRLQLANWDRESRGEKALDVPLHRIFMGRPGTGKTTVASIFGRLLKRFGFLSNGEVVLKGPADFLGDVVGASETKTSGILEACRGKVLVIDEAYGLNPKRSSNPYTTNVIDTLVQRVQGVPGEDIAIILAGYEDEMQALMRDANPGLARRFRQEDAFLFADYNDAELTAILREKVRKAGLSITLSTAEAAVRLVSRERMKPNFGNAGAVEIALSRAKERMQSRLVKSLARSAQGEAPPALNQSLLLIDDFDKSPANFEKVREAVSDLNTKLLAPLLDYFDELESSILFSREEGGETADLLGNLVITGPSGVGKSVIARRLGKMLFSCGLLPTDNVVEQTGSAMQGQYIGQTPTKVTELMRSARGGVLFIDEAGGLNNSLTGTSGRSFSGEAVETMLQLSTQPDYKGKMVIVLAGSKDELEKLFKSYPALGSRFPTVLDIPNWSPAQACDVLKLCAEKDGFDFSPVAADALGTYMKRLVLLPGWSNGRDIVGNLYPSLKKKRYSRLAKARKATASNANSSSSSSESASGAGSGYPSSASASSKSFGLDDLIDAFEGIFATRSNKGGSSYAAASAPAPAPATTATTAMTSGGGRRPARLPVSDDEAYDDEDDIRSNPIVVVVSSSTRPSSRDSNAFPPRKGAPPSPPRGAKKYHSSNCACILCSSTHPRGCLCELCLPSASDFDEETVSNASSNSYSNSSNASSSPPPLIDEIATYDVRGEEAPPPPEVRVAVATAFKARMQKAPGADGGPEGGEDEEEDIWLKDAFQGTGYHGSLEDIEKMMTGESPWPSATIDWVQNRFGGTPEEARAMVINKGANAKQLGKVRKAMENERRAKKREKEIPEEAKTKLIKYCTVCGRAECDYMPITIRVRDNS